MNTRQAGFFTALTLVAGATSVARADTADSPWGVAIYGGDAVTQEGSLRRSFVPTPANLGALDPTLIGATSTLSHDRLDYNDIYHRTFDAGIELSYSFSDNLETYGRFGYESLDGQTRRAGVLTSDAFGTGGEPLHARFADQDNKSFEIGSRYFWNTGSSWAPFAGLALGATRLDPISANFSVPNTLIDEQNVRFTRPSTVFSQSLETGVEFNPSRNFGVRFSVEADHMGEPSSARDPTLSELGFDAGHGANDRWTFPVSIAAAYHFG
jgi:hypothetical protein